jgi:hypothetical protein
VAWREVDAVLRQFVDEVATAFVQRAHSPYAWIAASGTRLHASIDIRAAIALYCARPLRDVAELLGVEEDGVVQALGHAAEADPAASAFCQMFRDLPPKPSRGIGAEARATLEASARTGPNEVASWTTARGSTLDAARAADTAEQAGQLAARAVRELLALDGRPIGDMPGVLAQLGITSHTSGTEARHEHMLVAAAPRHAPAVTILRTLQTQERWGCRFEQARALGHALLDPLRGDALGAIATKWTQSVRRRRSGAFAAELLVPRSAVDEASGGHLDGICEGDRFSDLLTRYGVGATTAAWQLYNHKRVSPQARADLIERHARPID